MADGITILHLITGLNVGGAEAMLAKLVGHHSAAAANQRHEVLSLMAPGVVGNRLEAAGIKVRSLEMNRGIPGIVALARLAWHTRQVRPDVIQGWMHHGNLAASIARRLAPNGPVLMWNVRHSLEDIAVEPRRTRALLRLEARISRRPAAIIYNSRNAARQYGNIGFEGRHATVIPNGFDCTRLAPGADRRTALRRLFGIRSPAPIVTMVARAHPMKSVETLVEALRVARANGTDYHLLLVGSGMDRPPPPLRRALEEALPPDRLTLVGHRTDLADWLPGADMIVLPSAWGEGFPNILGEAMACGVPCITTDVGDSGWIVGKTGLVIPPRDAAALAQAIGRLERLGPEGRRILGLAARRRVIENFSLDETVARYAALYAGATGQGNGDWPNQNDQPYLGAKAQAGGRA